MLPQTLDLHDAITQVALRDLIPPGLSRSAIVFVGGSLVEGFGNATSDIDLIAVVDLDEDVRRTSVFDLSFDVGDGMRVEVGRYNGVRVDLEILSLSSLADVALKLDRPWTDFQTVIDFPDEYLTTLHNLHIGIPIANAEKFEALRVGFPWSGLLGQLVAKAGAEYTALAEDAIGAIRSGDHRLATYASCEALGYAIDVYTAARGSSNSKAKWRYHKLDRLGEQAESTRCFNAVLVTDAESSSLISSAKQRLTMAQDLVARAHGFIDFP